MDGFRQAELDQRTMRVVSAELVAEGRTDLLCFEGWRGLGLRLSTQGTGTFRGLPGVSDWMSRL